MSSIAVSPGCRGPVTEVRRPARPAAKRPVASSHSGAAVPAHVRLTRRGRLLVLATFLALAFTGLTVFGDQSAATREAGVPVETRTVEVAQGDTLWQIAAAVAEPGEVREMIHHIEELNALTGAGLVEGQEIAVPVG